MKKQFTKTNILIIDDNESFLYPIGLFFNKKGYKVTKLKKGKELIDIIFHKSLNRNNKLIKLTDFQGLILDDNLQDLKGSEILKIINEKKQPLPPTILLSGYLNKNDIEEFLHLGVMLCMQKPVSPQTLFDTMDLLIKNKINNFKKSTIKLDENSGVALKKANNKKTILNKFRLVSNSKIINNDVKQREIILKKYFEKTVEKTAKKFLNIKNPLFIVGRRWNSWYPSFFDVPGGAYILILPKYRDNNEAVLIDPGFKCLKVLSDMLNISVANISTCVISHNHPDHIGGVFEYMACRNTLDKRCHLFCNPTTLKMFLNHRSIQQLNNVELDLLDDWDKSKYNKILISGFKTSHNEIGPKNKPMAIIIKFYRPDNNTEKVIILGDTEYKDSFIDKIADNNLKILVLHIGSAQLKDGTGKHLYLDGIRKLLINLDNKLEHIRYRGKLLVLISEWGLEHATRKQIEILCNQNLSNIKEESPIVETVNYLKNELNYINILPADIGLMVDIIDQNIYINVEKDEKYPFNKIDFKVNSNGIRYLPKSSAKL